MDAGLTGIEDWARELASPASTTRSTPDLRIEQPRRAVDHQDVRSTVHYRGGHGAAAAVGILVLSGTSVGSVVVAAVAGVGPLSESTPRGGLLA